MIARARLPWSRSPAPVRMVAVGAAVEVGLVVVHALLGAALDGRALAAAMAGTAPSWSLALGAFLVLARVGMFVVVPMATVFGVLWRAARGA